MRAFLHFDKRRPHQIEAMQALGSGLAEHGIEACISDSHPGQPCDLLVTWGTKGPKPGPDMPHLILEGGYINGDSGDYTADRLRFISYSWNRVHALSDPFARPVAPGLPWPEAKPDRWDAIGLELKPWKEPTDSPRVLLMEQCPGDAAAPPPQSWRNVKARIADFDHTVRPHPLMQATCDLVEDLSRTDICVTWASTGAVEAIIEGIPCITLSPSCIAWPVSSHDFETELFRGNREEWAYNLAYRQWTLSELASGQAWEYMGRGL